MNELFKFSINICILIIIASIVAAITENMKNGRLVRSAASVMIIIVTVSFILNIDLKSGNLFVPENYSVDQSGVWESTLENVEVQLEREMLSVCEQNGLVIDEISVELITDYKNIEIEHIDVKGADAQSAKNLIAGYFKVGLAYINIDGV